MSRSTGGDSASSGGRNAVPSTVNDGHGAAQPGEDDQPCVLLLIARAVSLPCCVGSFISQTAAGSWCGSRALSVDPASPTACGRGPSGKATASLPLGSVVDGPVSANTSRSDPEGEAPGCDSSTGERGPTPGTLSEPSAADIRGEWTFTDPSTCERKSTSSKSPSYMHSCSAESRSGESSSPTPRAIDAGSTAPEGECESGWSDSLGRGGGGGSSSCSTPGPAIDAGRLGRPQEIGPPLVARRAVLDALR